MRRAGTKRQHNRRPKRLEGQGEAHPVPSTGQALNPHHPASLYEEFEPAEARRIAERLEVHYTPKSLATRLDRVAGSWMDMAEIEIGALARQCLNRCISDQSALRREVGAWQQQRNRDAIQVDWRFTTSDARIKLKPLYPSAFNLRRNCSDLRGSEQLPAASSRWYKPWARRCRRRRPASFWCQYPGLSACHH